MELLPLLLLKGRNYCVCVIPKQGNLQELPLRSIFGGLRSRKTSHIQEPAMPENVDPSSARKTRPVSRVGRHPTILRVSSLAVASILSLLLINAVVPPIVADQSDRAVVNAPVTLLTSPIDGILDFLTMSPGRTVEAGDSLAQISNVRLDRGTLISLEEKAADAREKLEATQDTQDPAREKMKTIEPVQ